MIFGTHAFEDSAVLARKSFGGLKRLIHFSRGQVMRFSSSAVTLLLVGATYLDPFERKLCRAQRCTADLGKRLFCLPKREEWSAVANADAGVEDWVWRLSEAWIGDNYNVSMYSA